MEKQKYLFLTALLMAGEVLLITLLDYEMVDTHYSFDVLYCLPVLQAARLNAIHALRHSDSKLPVFIGILIAVIWSLSEAFIFMPDFPLEAFALNTFTRSVTFTVLGRVVTKLWLERNYARKDALTDLANRLEFFEKFEAEQLRSERSGKAYSLLFIDIDQFKMLNDDYGHRVGDAALKTISDILRDNSRKVDTLARIGGDEFAILLTETDQKSCEGLIDRIKSASENEFQKMGWQISLSIGYVTETGNKRSPDELLHEADTMMYAVKKSRS
ncbi:MAG TPA: GGDEF domain-containing protein [Gallionella sp.]|nr:GGDEF domain-containing protein [Gallionella sp.]